MDEIIIKQRHQKLLDLFYNQQFLKAIELSELLIEEIAYGIQNSTSIEQNNKFKYYLANIYQLLGREFTVISNFKNALQNFQKGLLIAQEIQHPQIIARIYGGIGEIFYSQGNVKQSIHNNQKAFNVIENTEFLKEKLMILGNLVQNYNELFDFESAKHYLNQIVEIIERYEITAYTGNLYYLEGLIESNQTNHLKAIEIFQKSLSFFHNQNHYSNIYFINIELIRSMILLDQLEEAEEKIAKLNSIEFDGKGEREEIEKIILYIILFIKGQNYSIAKFSINELLESISKLGLDFHRIIALNFKAIIHCLEGNFSEALDAIQNAKQFFQVEYGITRTIQFKYLEIWVLLETKKQSEASDLAITCSTLTSKRFINYDMFFLPKNVADFIENYH